MKLRVDPRNSFIAALAFSDLTLCVFTSPLTLWYTLEGHWPEAIDFGQGGREWESFLYFFNFARKKLLTPMSPVQGYIRR